MNSTDSSGEQETPIYIKINEESDEQNTCPFSCYSFIFMNLLEFSKDHIKRMLQYKKIHRTAYFNGKRVDILTYEKLQGKYTSSINDLLTSSLCEPYNIFLVSTILLDYGEICLAALADEKCVGLMLNFIKDGEDEPAKSGYICMIAVDESLRGFGLGSLLLNEGVKLMKYVYGATKVNLEAEASNSATLNFYAKNGFIRTGLLKDYYHNGEDAYVLERAI